MFENGYLYHYTSECGKDGIAVSHFIAPSTGNRLATAAEGVHFTDLPPTTDKQVILLNNYGRTGPEYERKAEYFVRVPKSQVSVRRETAGDGRVAYVHFGAGLNLRNIDFCCGKVGADAGDGHSVDGDLSEWNWLTVAGGAVGALAVMLMLNR